MNFPTNLNDLNESEYQSTVLFLYAETPQKRHFKTEVGLNRSDPVRENTRVHARPLLGLLRSHRFEYKPNRCSCMILHRCKAVSHQIFNKSLSVANPSSELPLPPSTKLPCRCFLSSKCWNFISSISLPLMVLISSFFCWPKEHQPGFMCWAYYTCGYQYDRPRGSRYLFLQLLLHLAERDLVSEQPDWSQSLWVFRFFPEVITVRCSALPTKCSEA